MTRAEKLCLRICLFVAYVLARAEWKQAIATWEAEVRYLLPEAKPEVVQ